VSGIRYSYVSDSLAAMDERFGVDEIANQEWRSNILHEVAS
jgi:hypothetical protein